MSSDLASAPRQIRTFGELTFPTFVALCRAGFHRYATYRQATAAAAATNTIFGFLRAYVLTAVVAGVPAGLAAGYDLGQLLTFAWVTQGLIGVVMLWGWTDLADRVRSGDVVADLLRPVHPVAGYLAVDLGRAGHAVLTRFVVPVLVGGLFFDLYLPRRVVTYPLFAASVLLGVVVSFGCRYLLNATSFWLLDVRGVMLLWVIASGALSGLAFPLRFLPSWLAPAVQFGTPFGSIMQAPLDILVERDSGWAVVGVLAVQAAWSVLLLGCCGYAQRRAERKLVIQGG